MAKLLTILSIGLSIGLSLIAAPSSSAAALDSTQTDRDIAINTIVKKKHARIVPDARQYAQLQPYRAQYKLQSNKMPLTANAVHTFNWLADGNVELKTQAAAMFSEINETAHIKWQDCEGQSIRYEYARQVFNKTVRYQQTFDLHQARYLIDGKTITIPFNKTESVNDRLLSQLKLRCQVKAGKKDFSIIVLDKDRIKTQKFHVVGNEDLNLPIGKIKTLKVERLRESSSKRTTRVWLAPQWDFIVVKALQENDDETVTLELVNLEFLPTNNPPENKKN